MTYDISEILKLPVEEQEEIANAIYRHLSSSEDKPVEETDPHFAKIESGYYKGYTLNEIKEKMTAKWHNRSSL